MGADLEVLAGGALDAALAAGASDAEVYAQEGEGIEVRVYEGEVEALTESAERGVGVRAWIDGRAGYAYGTDLREEGVRSLAAGAVEAARVADSDEFAGPPEGADGGAPDIVGLHDPTLAGWGSDRKVSLGQEVERAARADEHVVAIEDTVYADEAQRVAIASSSGARGGYESTSCYAYARAIAGDGDDRQTGLGFAVARGPTGLDAGTIGREAADRAVSLLGATKPASRTCPVVLDETVAASFIGFIGGVLCADAVQRGRSPFAGRLGEAIAADALTLTDDGVDPEGPASAPFDGEGTPRGSTPLIEAGRLATYLHDSYTARREGNRQRSTGNAARSGYRSPPGVSTSNLVIAEGEKTLDELFADAGDGVYITDVAGLHSGVNPVSGTFSVGASGRRIENGELTGAFSEFTIASDLPKMLTAVRAASTPSRWVPFGGSVKAPALLIGEMAIGGS